MRPLSVALVLLSLLSGCVTTPDQKQLSDALAESAAVVSLNQQIEEFNAKRTPGREGITPIAQRVTRVEHDKKLDQVVCFDENEQKFLVLKREPDGTFKGILEVNYHEAAFSGPGGSHSWGHVLVEFYLRKEIF